MDMLAFAVSAFKASSILFVAYYAYQFFIFPFYHSPLRHFPTPGNNHPLIGQTYNLFKGNGPNDLFLSWSRRWPDSPFIRYISFGNSEVLLVNTLRAHREVMQTKCYSFIKPPFFKRLVGEIVGVGLLFSEGDEHKKQRRLLVNPFSLANIKKILPVFYTKAQDLCATIQDTIDKDGSPVLEISSIFSKATLDIIGLTALGLELEQLSSASTSTYSFHEAYHTIFEQSVTGQVITLINMYIPLRSWLPLKANRRFVEATNDLHRMLRQIIKQRRTDIAERERNASKTVDGKDLLTFMIEERSGTWTDEEILGHLLNFVAAGHETTSGALTWAIYSLSSHPSIQAHLRNEIQSSLPSSQCPEIAAIESLHYLHNFVREVLRMHSPSVQTPRETATVVTIDGVAIPAGTTIMINPFVAHFHPQIWGPTAYEFNPDRWDSLSATAADPFAFQAFINGPRMCIGKPFALLEFKVLVIELLRRFKFEGVGEEVVAVNRITHRPKGGLRVKVSSV